MVIGQYVIIHYQVSQMSNTKDKLRILMCSDDPDTILSYGILSKMLIDRWYKYYDIHYCSLQYQMGKPQASPDIRKWIKALLQEHL